MHRVYLGYDYREHEAFEIAKFSIARRTKSEVEFIPLNHRELRQRRLFTRPWRILSNGQFEDERDGKPFSTEFAHSRFLVPLLERRERDPKDFVLFADCDILCLADIDELFASADKDKAIQVVKFENNIFSESATKMDNMVQSPYPRKLWSSVILWNVWHPANLELTLEDVNNKEGSWLHNFGWLMDSEIGTLDRSWNFIPNKFVGTPKIIHYTEGGPWMPGFENCTYADEWYNEVKYREGMKKILR